MKPKIGRPRVPLSAKLEKYVAKSGPDDCWEWIGGKGPQGYGQITMHEGDKSINLRAHRAAYELANGPIPSGLFVLHSCDNPSCVNPAHLFLGTHDDNMRDKVAKGRQVRGVRQRFAKLDWDKVREIRLRYANGETQESISKDFGVTQPLIGYVVRHDIWRESP